jgi:hypothetical protein
MVTLPALIIEDIALGGFNLGFQALDVRAELLDHGEVRGARSGMRRHPVEKNNPL